MSKYQQLISINIFYTKKCEKMILGKYIKIKSKLKMQTKICFVKKYCLILVMVRPVALSLKQIYYT